MKRLTSAFTVACFMIASNFFAIGQMLSAPPEKSVVIPDGTELSVLTTETISSKVATEGDPLNFKMEEDLVIDGSVVIAKGTMVKGVVSAAKKSGFFGKGGNLSVRIESTQTVDSQKIRLRASKGNEGSDKTGTTVALVILFGPLGFLKKGKNAEIKAGTQIKVYTDESKTVKIPQIPTP
jgi:hypothetical protein